MCIHRISEVDEPKFGLNWMVNKMTFFSLKILIPIHIYSPKNYDDFMSNCIYYGRQVRVICFRIRIRNWLKFNSKVKKVLFNFSSYIKPFGKRQLICTREMIEDGICPNPIEC